MHITKLALLGFKSFAEHTVLDLGPGVTAIVGPNGSGKSNVAEAIRWVLGEQNPRLLRAGRMEEFIFNGSAARRPVGLAEVRVTMGDEEGVPSSPFREVEIVRRLDRAGRSEYFLNRAPCRARDVEELLAGAGLARDAFFLAQGKVDAALSARPEERRRLLEEAVGLAVHQRRRAEALRLAEQVAVRLLPLAERARALREQLEPLRAEAARAARARELEAELGDLERRLLAAEWRRTRDQLASVAAARERLAERVADLERRTGQAREAVHLRRRELEDLDRALDRAGEELLSAATRRERLEAGLELGGARGEREKLSARREGLLQDLAREQARLEAARARLEMAGEAELLREVVGAGPRAVLEGVAAGTPELAGVLGMVADLVRVPAGLEQAVEAALGPAAQYFVARSQEAARRAVEWLKEARRGRATFLPLDGLRYSLPGRAESGIAADPACVGWAWRLVEHDETVAPAVAYLLGRVLVARDLAGALRLARESGFRWRVVTLDGDLVHAGGAVTGGAPERRSRLSLLGRSRLAGELAEEVGRLEAAVDQVRARLAQVDRDLAGMEAERRRALDGVAAELEAARAREDHCRRRLEELRRRREACLSAWRQAERGAESFLAEREEASRGLARLEREQGRLEASLRGLEEELRRVRGLGADGTAPASSWPAGPDPGPEGRRRAEELRRALAELGPVQPGAERAAEALAERLAAAEAEVADLEEACAVVRWLAAQVAEAAERALREAFAAWRESFHQVVAELLDGGEGELILLEGEGAVTGVEIGVRPPGRRWQPLHLLSGGERSLVAIGLLFALLRVRPAPVCVLDEVDAALDEANLARLAAYLRNLGARTQLLVVTHQKTTMEAADRLVGVTLGEDGASRVVSVRLSDATAAARSGAA